MKLVCRSCKYKQSVQDWNIKQCPECGSDKINIVLDKDEKNKYSSESVPIKASDGNIFMTLLILLGILLGIGGAASLSFSFVLGITLIIIGVILIFIGEIIRDFSK